MVRRPAIGLAFVLAALVGCRSNGRADLIEAELRTKDRQLQELQAELWRSEAVNEALENSLKEQRCAQPTCRSNSAPSALTQVKEITLGRGTGGINNDKLPGDEGLQVVLVPQDGDGSAVKAPGQAKVTAYEIQPTGVKQFLSCWDISANLLRRSWRAGLFSTGYTFNLPWQTLPTVDKLRVVVQFMPLEGGTFEAERDCTVHLPAEAIRDRSCNPPAGLAPPFPPQAPAAGLAPPLPAPITPAPGPVIPIPHMPSPVIPPASLDAPIPMNPPPAAPDSVPIDMPLSGPMLPTSRSGRSVAPSVIVLPPRSGAEIR